MAAALKHPRTRKVKKNRISSCCPLCMNWKILHWLIKYLHHFFTIEQVFLDLPMFILLLGSASFTATICRNYGASLCYIVRYLNFSVSHTFQPLFPLSLSCWKALKTGYFTESLSTQRFQRFNVFARIDTMLFMFIVFFHFPDAWTFKYYLLKSKIHLQSIFSLQLQKQLHKGCPVLKKDEAYEWEGALCNMWKHRSERRCIHCFIWRLR